MAITYVKWMLSSLVVFALGLFLGVIVTSHWTRQSLLSLSSGCRKPSDDFLRPVSRQDCYGNNATEALGSSISVVKPRGIDVVMARLFKFAPPGMPYADWVAPSAEVLTHADFLQHRFSPCCFHPFPPLDKSLRQVLSWPGGFFIESGGHDGKFQSNSLALEKFFGWRGLLIEPAISNIAKIHANRNRSIAIHAGLVALGEDGAKLSDPGGDPRGKIAIGSGNVKGRALSSLLDDLNVTEVDFWSLDVEGYEVQVLNGMDFRRLRPKLIVVEVWGYNRDQVFSMMTRVGYDLVVGYDVEKGISGFPQGYQHRDFLWKDSRWQHSLPKIVTPKKLSDNKTPDGEFLYGF
jgi:FkbM family methyltransferase